MVGFNVEYDHKKSHEATFSVWRTQIVDDAATGSGLRTLQIANTVRDQVCYADKSIICATFYVVCRHFVAKTEVLSITKVCNPKEKKPVRNTGP